MTIIVLISFRIDILMQSLNGEAHFPSIKHSEPLYEEINIVDMKTDDSSVISKKDLQIMQNHCTFM